MAKIEEIVIPARVELTVDLQLEGEQSNFDDVGDFHEKFGLVRAGEDWPAQLLTSEVQSFREKFLQEELNEFQEAWNNANLADAADALIDLVYVAMGTAHMMGLPWQELWDEVQRANMSKARAESVEHSKGSSGRGSALDVVKPEGWQPPDIEGVLARHG